jgi:hypothetical protein
VLSESMPCDINSSNLNLKENEGVCAKEGRYIDKNKIKAKNVFIIYY